MTGCCHSFLIGGRRLSIDLLDQAQMLSCSTVLFVGTVRDFAVGVVIGGALLAAVSVIGAHRVGLSVLAAAVQKSLTNVTAVTAPAD